MSMGILASGRDRDSQSECCGDRLLKERLDGTDKLLLLILLRSGDAFMHYLVIDKRFNFGHCNGFGGLSGEKR
jgi:hypothetical protein